MRCMQKPHAVGMIRFAGLFFFGSAKQIWGSKSKKIKNWNQKPRSKSLALDHWWLDEFYHDSSPLPTSSPTFLLMALAMRRPNSFRISVGRSHHSRTMTHLHNQAEVCGHVARLQELWNFSIHRYCQRQGGQCLTFGLGEATVFLKTTFIGWDHNYTTWKGSMVQLPCLLINFSPPNLGVAKDRHLRTHYGVYIQSDSVYSMVV